MIEEIKSYIPFVNETDAWVIQVFILVFVALLLDFLQKKVLRRFIRAEDTSGHTKAMAQP